MTGTEACTTQMKNIGECSGKQAQDYDQPQEIVTETPSIESRVWESQPRRFNFLEITKNKNKDSAVKLRL